MPRKIAVLALLSLSLVATRPQALEANGRRLRVSRESAVAHAFVLDFSHAARRFYSPLFTGWLHNAVGKKCDAWNDWVAAWLLEHPRADVKLVEETIFHREFTEKRWYWPSEHVAVRVTLTDGTVLYLDPWRYGPADPARTAAKYEAEWGQPDEFFRISY